VKKFALKVRARLCRVKIHIQSQGLTLSCKNSK